MKKRSAKRPKWVYHGSVADPLEVLAEGLTKDERKASEGRRFGVSVTTTVDRARWWGAFKRGDVRIYRVLSSKLDRFMPETAKPADPRFDFTTDDVIPPTVLEILDGDEWRPLVEAFSEILWYDDELRAEWEEKWGPVPP